MATPMTQECKDLIVTQACAASGGPPAAANESTSNLAAYLRENGPQAWQTWEVIAYGAHPGWKVVATGSESKA